MKSQKGSVVIIVLVLVIIGLIGAIGYLVYDRNQNKANTTTQQTKNVTQTSTEQNTKPNYSVRYVYPNQEGEVLTIQSETDLNKLPTDFPARAKEYLTKSINDAMADNTADCMNTITIDQYNDINVAGGVGATCGGGAAAVWSIGSDGNWQELYYQDTPVCADIITKKIYSEFIEICFDDKNADGQAAETEIIPNPNGSSALL